jgi:hypothetical protein
VSYLLVLIWVATSWQPISNAKIEQEMNRDQRKRR